ncbi:hypothetical protein KY290_010377 [Solanum tuberosum]|uniref:Uncharacterized protein n=1 Tax=Solanum tuberosum TaxID=4113 RepID=A0ABQ7VY85_SOLTU|nr:hypothetical protein KY284_010292 [Solanum tuberosum]KAH0773240.1 hypothetical protein KY290_010377 [Solanum tuberosum]
MTMSKNADMTRIGFSEYQSPLTTYASGEPFTSSPSFPLSETPTPNRHFSPPLSPIETPISTTGTTSPPSLPTHPLEQDLDDVLLSVLHSQKPKRPRKHIIVKQKPFRTPLTRSASQAQLQEGEQSRAKCRRLGKSPVPLSSSPVILDSESDDISASNPSGTHSQSKKASKNMKKFLEMGKEKYFRIKPVLRGRTFHPNILSINVVQRVCDLLNSQGWRELFLDTKLLVHEKEVVKFYTNLKVLEENVVTSTVNGVELVFDRSRLGEILCIPSVGLAEYVWATDEQCILTTKYSQGRVTSKARKVLKGEMAPVHKLLFELVHKGVLPRGHKRHIAYFCDMGIANALERKEPVDWPSLMIKHMARVAYPQLGSHQLAFGNLLTRVFTAFAVPLGEGQALTRADMFTQSTLAECGLIADPAQVPITYPRASGPVTRLLKDLQAAREQCETLQNENMSLRNELIASK